MKTIGFVCALVVAPPALSQPIPAQPVAPTKGSSGWDGALELQAGPLLGTAVTEGVGFDPVDEMEFETALRFRRTIDELRGLRVQFKAGVTSAPNLFDSDGSESSLYGEVQLGDTYLSPKEFRHARFGGKVEAYDNAVRPYLRYRLTSVHDDFLEQHKRLDHRAVLGLRYRRGLGSEADPDEPGMMIARAFAEVRGELHKVWSSSNNEEAWNPRFQGDFYSPTFLNRTRFVVKASLELTAFNFALAPNGKKRVDQRFRINAGFDLSDSFADWFDWKKRKVTVEILGRFQQRWSNDPSKEHTRAYFVPTIAVTLPLQ